MNQFCAKKGLGRKEMIVNAIIRWSCARWNLMRKSIDCLSLLFVKIGRKIVVLIRIKVVDHHLHHPLIVAVQPRAQRRKKRKRIHKLHLMVGPEIKNLVIKKLEEEQDQVHHLVQVQVNQVKAKRNLIMLLQNWSRKSKKKAQDHHLVLQAQVLAVKQTKRKRSQLQRSRLNQRKLQQQLLPRKRGRSQIHRVVLVELHQVQILMDQVLLAHLVHLQVVKSAEWKSVRKTLLVLEPNVQMKKAMSRSF